jgi:hypothetical protein
LRALAIPYAFFCLLHTKKNSKHPRLSGNFTFAAALGCRMFLQTPGFSLKAYSFLEKSTVLMLKMGFLKTDFVPSA